MPYSANTFEYYISTLIGLLQPATVCDIGPGYGKYAHIVRSRSKEDGFTSKITAVEIDESYVKEFQLETLYDDVWVCDAIDLIKNP